MGNHQRILPQSIVVIDDHILFREGLISLLRSAPDFDVAGRAGDIQEGVELAYQQKPDIILMDFSMIDDTGFDAIQAVLEELPSCKIIFLTIYETDENLFTAIHHGAKGYMLKNVSSSAFLSNLRALTQSEGQAASGKHASFQN
jgi:two-component system nitrate/nitrite response regulator NarL